MDIHQEIIDKLYASYNLKGFVSEDEALKLMSVYDISIKDTERIIGKILNLGVIFYSSFDQTDDNYLDFGFVNYDDIYNEIIKIDNNLIYLIDYIKKIRPPQKHEFENLYKQSICGNYFAKKRIIEMNMRIAVRQALFFSKKYSYPLEECIQDAFYGLVLGLEKYEPSKSLKFQIHIVWWIRQNLYKYILIGNYQFRYPSHLKEKLFKIYFLFKNKNDYYLKSNKKIIKRNIRQILNCKKSICNLLYFCLLKPLSFEYLFENFKTYFSDEEDLINNLNDNITNQYLHDTIFNIFSTLRGREADILLLRYGMGITKSHTLDEIGDKYGLTRERIRQIELKAIRRLRHPKRSKHLIKFYEERVKIPSDDLLPKNMKYLK